MQRQSRRLISRSTGRRRHFNCYNGNNSKDGPSASSTFLSGSSLSPLTILLLLGLAVVSSAQPNAPLPLTPTAGVSFLPVVTTNKGPILDAQCNIEDIEEANDSQLYTILQELILTSFFRTFAVELDTKCPLTADSSDDDEEEEEFQCGSGGGDDDSASALDVAFGGSSLLTEEAEPLCTVKEDDSSSSSSSSPFSSSALNSLSSSGFTSKDQQDTFGWKKQTDMVIEPNADLLVSEDCADSVDAGVSSKMTNGLLPDSFWMDMCSNITQGDGTRTVNLPLNPERNTGYNGTHIWEAIYQENESFGKGAHGAKYEQSVLYRLISGLHTSTTLSIASHYYPPSPRKGRIHWQAHPTLFYEKFQDHPEYIRNLHFSYVVLLRALDKAAPYLSKYEIRTGDIVQDHAATVLLKRLLDSRILQSCSNVFRAFDESSMFQSVDDNDEINVIQVQQNFKAVFHNISSILDCVQCQQCKLHGKLSMLGYGTALKILFMKPQYLTLERNEVVALINSIAKISESLRLVRELTLLYWEHSHEQQLKHDRQEKQQLDDEDKSNKKATSATAASKTRPFSSSSSSKGNATRANNDNWELVDVAVGLASSLGKTGHISKEREAELVQLALNQDPKLLILAKHYRDDLAKFLELSKSSISLMQNYNDNQEDDKQQQLEVQQQNSEQQPDAIVVGSGLAGLAATLNILDRGGTVVLIEKEHLLGGNSNKASSGINACCPYTESENTTTISSDSATEMDTIEVFAKDTIKSAGDAAKLELIEILTENSAKAVTWLRERVGVDLSLKAQLGGHSYKRTHRPKNGMAGAEIIYGMSKAVRKYQKSGKVIILVDTVVTELLTTTEENNDKKVTRVVGVKYKSSNNDGDDKMMYSPNVILATGGFASDRSPGSYLEQYRPELLKFPTTAGSFSTGDGIALATSLGADINTMDKVQLHPTGWVDPKDRSNPTKILAAELMRGVGGVLLNHNGERFCNELGTRAYVTDKMLSHNVHYAKTGIWPTTDNADIPTFYLILSSKAVSEGGAKKHVDLYTHKGLLTKVEGIKGLADFIDNSASNATDASTATDLKSMYKKFLGTATTNDTDMSDILLKTFTKYYDSYSGKGVDEFGKRNFRGIIEPAQLESETFYIGMVTPVLHYCMGGITIDGEGNVLNTDGNAIEGLHAAGEVTGGVHGNNRLGGNSLLECTVYGTIVGEKIPINTNRNDDNQASSSSSSSSSSPARHTSSSEKKVTMKELQKHNSGDDCWVAINGNVYDLTDFAEEHPAGAQSIYDLGGTDGSEAFFAVHNQQMLEDFDDDFVGVLV